MPQSHFPQPTEDELSRSNHLRQRISELIEKHGSIPFANYMHQALYTPNLGYYSSGHPKLGKHGDFVTAPELTPLFGQCIASQFMCFQQAFPDANILEFGAGSGQLALDILLSLDAKSALPEQYFILEISADLKQKQQQKLAQHPVLLERVTWLTELPSSPVNAFVIANEVLDAMPVHRFIRESNGYFEEHVGFSEGEFIPQKQPISNPKLQSKLNTLSIPSSSSPYRSEVNLWIEPWLKSLFACLDRGLILIIDYGFPRHEYYHPQRNQGTLMCHYKHHAHDNAYIYPGLQDITAHVDFTDVACSGLEAGFEINGFTNQASFLIGCGLIDIMDEFQSCDTQPQRTQQAIKLLTHPCEMGELFKVLAMNKNTDIDLPGFKLFDKQHTLIRRENHETAHHD